jgi:hypothetical protein
LCRRRLCRLPGGGQRLLFGLSKPIRCILGPKLDQLDQTVV